MADGYRPTLAIVFISIKQDRNAIRKILDEKGIDVFGATSCGEFVEGTQSEGEAVVLLLDLSREAYAILYADLLVNDIDEDDAPGHAQSQTEKLNVRIDRPARYRQNPLPV